MESRLPDSLSFFRFFLVLYQNHPNLPHIPPRGVRVAFPLSARG